MKGRAGPDVFGDQIGVLTHAIAGALDLDDDSVMEQPVEQRSGDNGIAEHIAPFGEAPVRGQDHGAFLVAGIDELEEQVAATWGDRQIADFVDHQQRTAAQEADFLPQRTLAFGFGEDGDEIGERDEVDTLSGADRLDCGGEVGFAGTWWPEQVDDLGTGDEVEAGERHDPVAVERRLEREVEAGERFDDGQSGHAQGRLDPAVLAQAEFLGEKVVDRFDAVDFALLDAAQRGIEHFEHPRHLQPDQAVSDIVDARGCRGHRRHRPALASWAPIAW
jgi:hypothetical protein